jgi:hypothetical protein
MGTSLQYTFPTIDADLIIRDAFERCGILNYLEDAVRYDSARRSLNLLLQHWPNRGFNLFTLEQGVTKINPGQNVYALPVNTSKLLQCKLANSNQILGGEATSSTGGDASALFATTVTTSFAQPTVNGNISYLYPQATPIVLVGIQSAITAQYQCVIECSYLSSPAEEDWITVLETPLLQYYNGAAQWFYLPFTENAVNWRIRQINADVTGTTQVPLNLVQIYFGIPYNSIPMAPIGNDLFFQFPSNSQNGASTTYWTNRTRIPTLNVWPIPNTSYQFFFYLRVRYIQDVGDFTDDLDIRATFIDAAVAGLAAKLAQKFAPDRYDMLAADAETVYVQAGREDTENVSTQMELDGVRGRYE